MYYKFIVKYTFKYIINCFYETNAKRTSNVPKILIIEKNICTNNRTKDASLIKFNHTTIVDVYCSP